MGEMTHPRHYVPLGNPDGEGGLSSWTLPPRQDHAESLAFRTRALPAQLQPCWPSRDSSPSLTDLPLLPHHSEFSALLYLKLSEDRLL